MEQVNKTIDGDYISNVNETKLKIDMRKGDYDFITKKATAISTYWFIDCKYYGQTDDFAFAYNFTSPDVTYEIGALVIASYDPPTTTTALPPTTTTMPPANVTTVAPIITTIDPNGTPNGTNTVITMLPTTVMSAKSQINFTTAASSNASTNAVYISLPFICSNVSLIPPDPNKTYGYFYKKIHVRGE